MEINPLHNGHIYFLEQVKQYSSDLLVAVISTNLTQRGEISVLNKTTKTKLLLEQDVDIVVELPSYFANQGGLYFAKAAITILKSLNVTDLYFGSELNDIDRLLELSLTKDSFDFKNGIFNLKKLQSNDILGVSYLKNIKNTNIIPHCIKRISNNYNEKNLSGEISSATAIRNNLDDNNIKHTLPKHSFEAINIFDDNILLETFFINLDYAYENKLNIFLSEEGQLINKLYYLCKKYEFKTIKDITNTACDKNNSKYKIRRLINNIVLLQEKIELEPYIKILGFNTQGQKYLKNISYITTLKQIDSPIKDYEVKLSNILYRHNMQPKNVDFLKPTIKGEIK